MSVEKETTGEFAIATFTCNGAFLSVVLVTGASGFIASHIIKQLLEEGYKVRSTVRSLKDEEKVKLLRELYSGSKSEVQLVEADLINADSWKEAVKDAKYVIHVASPFPNTIPSNPDSLLKPAVDGTVNVLKACAESGTVKRVVITSSICAVYDSSLPIPKENEETKTFNEENWTNGEDPHLDVYAKSKLMAEKAAWDYVKELPDGKKFELVAINPGMVFGPLYMNQMGTSVEMVKRLMDRSVPAVAKLSVNATDVRDVALAHIRALTVPEAAGKRHLIVTSSVMMKDIAVILQKEFKPQGYHIPTMVAPNFFVWMSSLMDKTCRLVVPRLGREYKFENKRMQEILGITPTELEKTIIDTANSLIEKGIVKKPKEKKAKKAKDETDATEG
ncbi:putative uncharacterized oxidoreductase-like protein [Leptotrombidium deliense]|uniref:Uncharacterized oxidoreductase-like protein n=1 Tax=Leptotrombidium deliense TaxID=299467 RepID=A0A443SSW7_9ACAR|nr:putative uncharacterized oxidoreductase-like protein [Leptotrombidium deliense]